ncbi:MAG: selenoprotein B glycine/betaine/sarcosine/D-proline reductase [Chloroflexi bacterium]|nr:selenoprotein B glycine/betaine/sarcosine/D-proline reductase [Chloroflexota bacterium]
MVRLDRISKGERKLYDELPCPELDTQPWVEGPPLNKRRVAIISTAGLHKRDDRPFTLDSGDYYRIIPSDIQANDLIMSHVSPNFDRVGFQQDWNVVFPLDRLWELARARVIGSVADFHYSFMGGHDPISMEAEARVIAGLLKKDRVDAVVFLPV